MFVLGRQRLDTSALVKSSNEGNLPPNLKDICPCLSLYFALTFDKLGRTVEFVTESFPLTLQGDVVVDLHTISL